MAWYFCRIELHKKKNKTVTEEDYETLHVEMHKKGFVQRIDSDEGIWYHLLTGEYYCNSTDTIEAKKKDAKEAAANTIALSENIQSSSVFIVLFSSARWTNLEQIK